MSTSLAITKPPAKEVTLDVLDWGCPVGCTEIYSELLPVFRTCGVTTTSGEFTIGRLDQLSIAK
jgi:hypothetical protein